MVKINPTIWYVNTVAELLGQQEFCVQCSRLEKGQGYKNRP